VSPPKETPSWLFDRWSKAYGEATALSIAKAHLSEAPLDLSVNGDAAEWAAKLAGITLPTGTVRLQAGGRVESLEGFSQGAWWVQDTAASLPAKLLGDVTGKTVIDLCAAPGGKTAQLAASGAQVTAIDVSANRLDRLRKNLSRLKLAADIIQSDGRTYKPSVPVDALLLDAPCLSTGTIRRHPELPHLKMESNLGTTTKLQSELLDAAARMIKPGGQLVYAVCSLEPEEAEQQIAAFLSRNSAFAREPIAPDDVGGLGELVTREGDLRTLPCHLSDQGGMDGFYAARLRYTD
jgi:16S rRNA (cytosine967-C5)-methyltransferase